VLTCGAAGPSRRKAKGFLLSGLAIGVSLYAALSLGFSASGIADSQLPSVIALPPLPGAVQADGGSRWPAG
jgi:hypothetical protein